MIGALRARLQVRYRSKADEAITKLQDDAHVLGIGPISPDTLHQLRRYHENFLWSALLVVPALAFEWWLMVRLVASLIHLHAPAWVLPPPGPSPAEPAPTPLMQLVQLVAGAAAVGTPLLLFEPTIRLLRSIDLLEPIAFERISVWATVISECADVVRNPGSGDTHVQCVSLRVPIMRVRGARTMRGTVPLFSRRHKVLKAHAEGVIAALRKVELRLDADPEAAAKELARLLLKISDRYVDKRPGALLDDTELVEAERRHEVLRLCLALAFMGAATLAVSRFHLPPPVAMAAAGIGVAMIYRNAVATGLGCLVDVPALAVPREVGPRPNRRR
ncbi:hypothetical protein [Streptomyces sp. NPDC051993]|uniref:hypothetical protein n=1 Tax=Streptomyces sp. NPDC051993 TaxID=3155286 RepID=UPI003415B635